MEHGDIFQVITPKSSQFKRVEFKIFSHVIYAINNFIDS